ncbi:Asp-tRNA(Asn)/Glu-tRNA(Gln) amidotransferase subunit GatA [Christensenella tenuis]|jgi:aspartyl-tRNA(Asn)/glutamyl-tRNA(Gln) amidotransferase subunit A|uniref:Glutamyl-tRNA(Gln) amidotransferase subunit A n=1 Tax=Christensenella tenuis TaxID=2763033 RepID=A0ABR7EBD2_9FIRM|nr:Asp-tRNA(Asn)/Glu-tRNA(Gln) amidotransferase subunit GatA [Christensenella tenuis]MBC5647056.1 Asp-tRNA(Asn)/Glu-tRNA(Gln) amidotransferase subunit GatA [Christensenella tenuis]
MELTALNIVQAAELLAKKELSSTELTQAYLDRIEKVEPKVNALVTTCAEDALESARHVDEKRAKGEALGRLAGIPTIIKDNMCTKGILSTASSKMLYNYKPVYDATVIEKLKAQDYVLLAKANMDEFAMGSSTETSYFGVTKNPWDTSRVPGGSSGGSAACVAADESVFSLGSDTGGSVRQPAAFCGVVGLKPTYGTVSRFGLMAFASSLDQIGPLTKTVEDSALVLDVISGNDKKDSTSAIMEYPHYGEGMKKDIKGLKVGIPKEYLEQEIDPEVRQSYLDAIKLFEDMGAIVEETSLPTFDYALSAYYVIASAEVASNLSRFDGIRYGYRTEHYSDLKEMYKNTRSEGFGDETKRRIMLGNYVLSSGYYDAYYLKALKVKTLIKNDFDRLFSEYDILLSPTAPTPAFKIGAKATPLEMYVNDLFTVPVNIAGVTAISVPSGVTGEGLPVSVQMIAKAFDENTMFRAAWNFEQAVKFDKKPTL